MILLDEHYQVVHDEDTTPSEKLVESLHLCNFQYAYADENTLYRFNTRGDLYIVSLMKPKFQSVAFKVGELEEFRAHKKVATEKYVARDVGCELTRLYLDDCSFTVPTELLLR